jgi:hypothetical protein
VGAFQGSSVGYLNLAANCQDRVSTYRVTAALRQHVASYSTSGDFCLADRPTKRKASEIFAGGTYLPYCVDYQRNRVIYVRTSNLTDSKRFYPLFYLMQRRHAEEVAAVPFNLLPRSSALSTARPILILSPGRCGSTLLLRSLHRVGALSISEPDSFTSIALRLLETGSSHPVDSRIVSTCMASLLEAYRVTPVIKLRGVCCSIISELVSCLPQASFVFILRRPTAWARSVAATFGSSPFAMARVLRQVVVAYDAAIISGARVRLLWYEDLVRRPEKVAESVYAQEECAPNCRPSAFPVRIDAHWGGPLAKAKVKEFKVSPRELSEFRRLWAVEKPRHLLRRHNLERLE